MDAAAAAMIVELLRDVAARLDRVERHLQEPPARPNSVTLTLDAAADLVGLSPVSLANRIKAAGGRRAWPLVGRLPGKAPTFDRDTFLAWWRSPANQSPARTRAEATRRARAARRIGA